MEKILLERIKEMYHGNNDTEMNELGRLLFWTNDPTYQEYKFMLGIASEEGFEESKKRIIQEYKNQISNGQGTTGETQTDD